MFYAILISLALGLGIGLFIYHRISVGSILGKRTNTESHTTLMLEKVERVFKVVTTEGFFSEILDYKHENKQLFGLLSSTKKSLVICNAKVLIGFDLKKVNIHLDHVSKKLTFDAPPEPEILAIEPDIKFYDIDEGWFNKFEAEDYNELLKLSKNQISNKVYDSELMLFAKKQLKLMLEQLSEVSDYQLEMGNHIFLPKSDKLHLNQEN